MKRKPATKTEASAPAQLRYAMLLPRALLAAHFDRKLNRGLDLFQQWPGFLQTFSIGLWAFGAVLQQLAGLGIDTDFVCHATILDYSHPKCKPLAKRLGEMRRPANQSPQFMRFAPGSPGCARRVARSKLEPFKLALVKTELEGRVDRRLLSRV